MKPAIIISTALVAGLILTGCENKIDADYTDAAPTESATAQERIGVPSTIIQVGYSGVHDDVVWEEKKDVDTDLNIDAQGLNITQVGKAKYSNEVKPDEGTELYAVRFERTTNDTYAATGGIAQGSYEFSWGNLDPHVVHIPERVESGVIVLGVPEGEEEPVLAGVMPGGPAQEVSLVTGERTTGDYGKAFYADHAGFIGKADPETLEGEGQGEIQIEGVVDTIAASYYDHGGNLIEDGNAVDIIVDWKLKPNVITNSSDISLFKNESNYRLYNEDGTVYEGEPVSEHSNEVRFTVPVIEEQYNLQVNINGETRDAVSQKRESTWQVESTMLLSFQGE